MSRKIRYSAYVPADVHAEVHAVATVLGVSANEIVTAGLITEARKRISTATPVQLDAYRALCALRGGEADSG